MIHSTKRMLPPNLVLTAVLSSVLTIVFLTLALITAVCCNQPLSLVYLVISGLALLFRNNCSAASLVTAAGDKYFWNTIYNVYIRADTCTNSIYVARITSDHTVFIFAILILCSSALSLVTAIALITIVQDEQSTRCLYLVVFTYAGSYAVSLVIDVTAATHFGLDYSHLTTILASSPLGSNENYQTEVIRQGAFHLMGIAMKGYLAHAVNLVLLVLMIVYAVEHRNMIKKYQHSIHKLGALNAFEQQRKQEDNWSQPDTYSQAARRSERNDGFILDEEPPRMPIREPTRSDYMTNGSFDRSNSWQQAQPSLSNSGRPFSYLEEVKRPVATRPPGSPVADASWHRDAWSSVPTVPAPDYSPQTPRRLKSALKPAYM